MRKWTYPEIGNNSMQIERVAKIEKSSEGMTQLIMPVHAGRCQKVTTLTGASTEFKRTRGSSKADIN